MLCKEQNLMQCNTTVIDFISKDFSHTCSGCRERMKEKFNFSL